jgi:hypothetical protein
MSTISQALRMELMMRVARGENDTMVARTLHASGVTHGEALYEVSRTRKDVEALAGLSAEQRVEFLTERGFDAQQAQAIANALGHRIATQQAKAEKEKVKKQQWKTPTEAMQLVWVIVTIVYWSGGNPFGLPEGTAGPLGVTLPTDIHSFWPSVVIGFVVGCIAGLATWIVLRARDVLTAKK